MDAWKNRLASVPKKENLKERRRFNNVARQLRNDTFPVEKTYRLAGGGVLPEAIGLLKALEKEMKALFATLKKGSTAHQVHLKEVLRIRGLLQKDPAVQELQANPNATKGVFEGLFERGKQSLYGMFRTMYRYRWTGLKVATLALIAYLAWSYFASPGTAAIVAPSKALVPVSPSSKALVPVGSVRSRVPEADTRGFFMSRGEVADAAREGATQPVVPPPTEMTDLGELEHGRTGVLRLSKKIPPSRPEPAPVKIYEDRLVPVGPVRSSIPEADVSGVSLSPKVSAEYEDALDLEHEVVTIPDDTIDLDAAGMGYTDTIRLPKSDPTPEGPPVQLNDPKVDNVQILDDFKRQYGDTIRLPKSSFRAPVPEEPVNLQDDVHILSDFTRRKPHYKNEYMEIWGRGDAKPQYDFEFFPQTKGEYDITIFPKNEEEYLVAGGKMTENERYLIDAFSAQAKRHPRNALVAWARTLLIVVKQSRYQEKFEDDNARIWFADKVFSSTKKKIKKTKQKKSAKDELKKKRAECRKKGEVYDTKKKECRASKAKKATPKAKKATPKKSKTTKNTFTAKQVPDVKTVKSFLKDENALGVPGKEGVTYRMDWNGNDYAVKTFKKRKSGRMIEREAGFQRVAAEHGVAPKVILVDQKEKFIVMERVAMRLIDFMRQRNMSTLSEKHQAQLIEAMKALDRVGLLHNDGNILNLMVDQKGNLKIIDYGMTKKIDSKMKKKYKKSPNGQITLPNLIRGMKHHKINSGRVVDAYIKK